MALYVLESDHISQIPRTTFGQQKLKEREHLQALLKRKPDIISPDTLIVAEEFSDWEDSQRRIDLLGLDRDAKLVVIELKRTEDGGFMDLQAIRYAAMISTMTFEKLTSIYEQYLRGNGIKDDARSKLLNFLDPDEPDVIELDGDVRIVLASADFSRELTTSVLWLNDCGLDVRCVRMRPYDNGGQVLLDVQHIIPLPETADYQIRIREKKQSERIARTGKDYSRFDVSIGGELHPDQNKRRMMLLLVSEAFNGEGTPQQIWDCLPNRRKLVELDGVLDADQVEQRLMEDDKGGVTPNFKRYFWDCPFQHEGKTYVLSNQWGTNTHDTAKKLASKFPELKIEIKVAGMDDQSLSSED